MLVLLLRQILDSLRLIWILLEREQSSKALSQLSTKASALSLTHLFHRQKVL